MERRIPPEGVGRTERKDMRATAIRDNRLVRLQLKKVVVFVGLDGQENPQTSPLFCPDGQGLFQKITFDLLK